MSFHLILSSSLEHICIDISILPISERIVIEGTTGVGGVVGLGFDDLTADVFELFL
jgi:hypothetical protein